MAEVKMPESVADRFPGNSYKEREANKNQQNRPELEPVVKSGGVKVSKKSEGRKILDRLFGSDEARSVGDYIFYDVLVPAAKDMIYDAVTGGLSMRLFGTSRVSSRVRRNGHTDYNGISRQARPVDRSENRVRSTRSVRSKMYDNCFDFNIRSEAYQVLDILMANIESDGCTTLADFYHLCELPSDFTDNNYGWYDLSTVKIRPYGDKWRLTLPPVQWLNDETPF